MDTLFDIEPDSNICHNDNCGRTLVNGRCLWCDADKPDYRKGRHRRNDQPGSVAGARSVVYRAGTQKALLMAAFEAAWPNDLTDEEAATNAGVSLTSEYSKRCGELRDDGVIVQVEGRSRMGGAGIPRLVSVYVKDRTSEIHAHSSDSPVPVPADASPACPNGHADCDPRECPICEVGR